MPDKLARRGNCRARSFPEIVLYNVARFTTAAVEMETAIENSFGFLQAAPPATLLDGGGGRVMTSTRALRSPASLISAFQVEA